MKQLERKSDIVRNLVAAGNYRKALSIAKDFRLGFTKEDKKVLVRAHECFAHPGWYKQLGINEDEAKEAGIELLKKVYGK